MPNKKPSIVKQEIEKADVIRMLTNGAAASIAAIPALGGGPSAYLVSMGASYVASAIEEMGSRLLSFIESKAAKNEGSLNKPYSSLFETYRVLGSKTEIDEEYLGVLANLHALTFSKDLPESDEIELYALLETARKLTGPEISIILASYYIDNKMYSEERMAKVYGGRSEGSSITYANAWATLVSNALGYSTPEYVESKQDRLEELRLIRPRNFNQHMVGGRGDDFTPNNGSRLTNYGKNFAKFVISGGELLEKNKVNAR